MTSLEARDARVLGLLVRSLEHLSAPASHQVSILSRLGEVGVDELALEMDDVLDAASAALGRLRGGESAQLALRDLDRQLVDMSGEARGELWHHEALSRAPEWATVRKKANRVLDELRRLGVLRTA
jgi:hypothetical protein